MTGLQRVNFSSSELPFKLKTKQYMYKFYIINFIRTNIPVLHDLMEKKTHSNDIWNFSNILFPRMSFTIACEFKSGLGITIKTSPDIAAILRNIHFRYLGTVRVPSTPYPKQTGTRIPVSCRKYSVTRI